MTLIQMICPQCGESYIPPGNIGFCSTACQTEFRIQFPLGFHRWIVAVKMGRLGIRRPDRFPLEISPEFELVEMGGRLLEDPVPMVPKMFGGDWKDYVERTTTPIPTRELPEDFEDSPRHRKILHYLRENPGAKQNEIRLKVEGAGLEALRDLLRAQAIVRIRPKGIWGRPFCHYLPEDVPQEARNGA